MIGEFEFLTLAAAARLGENAYGASVREEIERVTERRCAIGALYTTLDRLESKGLVKTWMGPSTAQRGGRARRMISVTPQGMEAAAEFYATILRVSEGLAWGVRP